MLEPYRSALTLSPTAQPYSSALQLSPTLTCQAVAEGASYFYMHVCVLRTLIVRIPFKPRPNAISVLRAVPDIDIHCKHQSSGNLWGGSADAVSILIEECFAVHYQRRYAELGFAKGTIGR